jgi:hypothetical protein
MSNGVREAFIAWARSRAIGCMFSRAMFAAPEKFHISVIELEEAEDAVVAVAAEVERLIADPQSEGAVLLLPGIKSPAEVTSLLKGLELSAGWLVRVDHVGHGDVPYAVLGVDVPVGRDMDADVLSELLVFADFDYLPVTRRAPCTAFTLRTKAARSDTPLEGRIERRANLAAINFDVPKRAFEKLWKQSQDLRAELDGSDNPFARARVAIGLPADLWNDPA